MNTKNLLISLLFAATLVGGSAYAGDSNTLTGGTDSAAIGASAMFDVTWSDEGVDTTVGLQFDVEYDNSVFSFVGCTFNGPWGAYFFADCTDMGTAVQVGLARFPTAAIENSSVTMEFMVDNGPPGTYAFPIPMGAVVTTGDNDGTSTTDASVDVLGPAYNSLNSYAPGDPIAFGAFTIGTTNPSESFDIDNIGELTTVLDGSCSITGPGAGIFSITSSSSFSVPEAGPEATMTVECNSSTATLPDVGDYFATLSCGHNGGPPGAASPVDYPLSCTIIDIDRPTYQSTNPMIGGTFEFGDNNLTSDPTDPAQTMTIENVGTDKSNGLVGSCSIINNPNGAYSLSGDGAYDLGIGETSDQIVTCDTDIPGDHNGGILRCTAADPASNQGNFDYTLNCMSASIPSYDSSPAPGASLPNITPNQGNGPESETLTISNDGEPASVLTGSCALTGSNPEITIVGSNTFSVLQGSTADITVQCEGDVGNYFDNLACTADAPADDAGTFNNPITCIIGQPDPAIYASVPGDGGTIDVNNGNPPPPEGNGVSLTTTLNISNAAMAGDDDLELISCGYTGDAAITASAVTPNTLLAPGADLDVTFTCDSSTAGMFSGTYECDYDEQPTPPPPPLDVTPDGGSPGTASYPVECEVREQYSDVTESPASGTPFTAELMPNEQTTFSVTFTEEIDELLDGEVDCSLASGTDFAFTMNGPGITTVPSGDSVQVDVTFTDPGQGDTFTDTLNCTINDNEPPAPGFEGGGGTTEDVSWPLEVTVIGRNATFLVTKDFNDDNPMGVDVALDCNTGLPLFQTGTVHDGDASLLPGQFSELEFIIVDFEPGDLNCEVYEIEVPLGYAVSYDGDFGEDGVAASAGETADACVYTGIESADFTCQIDNDIQLVDLTVNKEWIDDNPGFNLPTHVEIRVECFNLSDAQPFGTEGGPFCFFDGPEGNGGSDVCFYDYIDPNNPGVYGFYPDWDGSTYCRVTETPEPGVEVDDSDCANVPLAPGVGGECTIVNTRLYEGIPTLSQYGLILMALMMLGVGMVAFRRYG